MSQTNIIHSYLDAGLAIIPIRRDHSKAPCVSWTQYETEAPDRATVDAWLKAGHEGWAMICGAVSGSVEVIDFDDPATFDPWCEQIDDELLKALVICQTPSGGWHVAYRCREIGRNQPLARRPGETPDARPETLIETRGEGGYILVDPTTADYHEAGKPYRVVQGSLTHIREIVPVEREGLLDAARLFNEYFPNVSTWEPRDNGNADDDFRPGDDFADHTSWAEILEPHGWRAIRNRGDRIIWQRPGKDGPGGSAQTGGSSARTGFDGLWVYSTNAVPLEPDRGYGKFSAYATLNFQGDYSAAAGALAAEGWGRQVIIRPKAKAEPDTDPDPPAEIPDTLDGLRGVEVPDLPESAYLNPVLGQGASQWLDDYAAFSRQWSPRAFDDFHLACGIWLLSTVAARRVVVHLGGPRYSNLYIALVARTSLWAKSTTAKIVTQTLDRAGLSFLLAPDDSTPQRFIADLVLRAPAEWDQLSGEAREQAQARMAFAASRGWFYEELGQKIDAMLSPGGFMADFRGILRAFDDCPPKYEYASIGRGLDSVQNPYVAMLGNMTPADLRRATRKNDALWQDGFWARWAFVTPPAYVNSSRSRFPEGERIIPDSLLRPIVSWHQALQIPGVEVEERRNAEGKPTGEHDAYVSPMARTHVEIDKDAADAFYAYHDGLLDIVEASENRDFDGNYARFAEKALRVAMMIGSLEHNNRITFPVWARAQTIAERWRRSLHELYTQANEPEPSEQIQKEEQAMEIVTKLDEPTAAEAARYARGVSSQEMAMTLDGLVHAGALVRVATTRRGTIRYAVAP